MTYGFRVVQEMISGLSEWMDAKGHADLDAIRGRAVPNVTDWQYLNLNYVAKARIDQDLCIHCGRCFAACEDTSHQAIAMLPGRVFEVKDDECVACNLCVNVCPVEDCITMVALAPGTVDARTGKVVEPTTPTGRRTRTTRWPRRRSSRATAPAGISLPPARTTRIRPVHALCIMCACNKSLLTSETKANLAIHTASCCSSVSAQGRSETMPTTSASARPSRPAAGKRRRWGDGEGRRSCNWCHTTRRTMVSCFQCDKGPLCE